jgi:hypothetical protein
VKSEYSDEEALDSDSHSDSGSLGANASEIPLEGAIEIEANSSRQSNHLKHNSQSYYGNVQSPLMTTPDQRYDKNFYSERDTNPFSQLSSQTTRAITPASLDNYDQTNLVCKVDTLQSRHQDMPLL